MKFLIVGLGNIGNEYAHTRHNTGFDTLDTFCRVSNVVFDENKRYGAIAECQLKGHTLTLLKPSTYMNDSGKAVRYWLQKENIPIEQLLVIVDDIALPFGSLRLRGKGSDAGHNGLKSIQQMIETQNYARLKFGIGNDFNQGRQIDYVLSRFTDEEQKLLPERFEAAAEIIKSFMLEGLERAMNKFNKK
ncbi:MAG: aminoacyl-tRNA hydrolase [Prevotellaceae bacterium]|jgi:PTH1 family peptidyl-tRNA hydrolase|nr:aminoacyl-tRNA hydrolase [Prevotellaceae bacterium]